MKVRASSTTAALALAVFGISGGWPATGPTPAFAKGNHPTLTNVIPQAAAVTIHARISALDPKSRELTLEGGSGAKVVVLAGPAVRLNMLKVGDTVNARYYRSVGFLVVPPSGGTGVPGPGANEIAQIMARPAEAPGGIGLRVTKVSGTVVGVDAADHTVDLINPSGGGVYTVKVTDPDRIAMLPKLKVGDTITAVISQALAVSIDPAPKGLF